MWLFRSWRRGVLISLGLGVVTTVLLAWGAAAIEDTNGLPFGPVAFCRGEFCVLWETDTSNLRTQTRWSVFAAGEPLRSPRALSDTAQRTPCRWSRAHWPDAKDVGHLHMEVASGWPMRSMVAEHRIPQFASSRELDAVSVVAGISIADGPSGLPRALPLRAIPVGFAVDSLLSTTTWWLLLFAFPTVRRIRRHRRGACLRCGYGPLPSRDARCPECGSIRGERPVAA